MPYLSDPAYQLPQIVALSSFNPFSSGSTKPMGVHGVNVKTGERGQYVVKFRNSGRMSVESSCREMLGAWMALELDISCVEPVMMNITDAFVKTLIGREGYKAALQSIGNNFASVYEACYQIVPLVKFHLNEDFIQQARKIFMFDMLIHNADRGARMPNVLSNSEKLLVYDHEMAFSFVNYLSFGKNSAPWEIGPSEMEMVKLHYFYGILKEETNDFTQLITLLDRFTDNFWQKTRKWIPPDWQTDDLKIIKEHVTQVVSHKHLFAEQLTLILAP